MSADSVPPTPPTATFPDQSQFFLRFKIAEYQGRIKLNRLLHLALIPPSLQVKYPDLKQMAINMALITLKTIPDCNLYASTFDFLRNRCGLEQPAPDAMWIKTTTNSVHTRLSNRMSELTSLENGTQTLYGIQYDRPAIYRANTLLGHVFCETGKTGVAQEYYTSGTDPKNGVMIAEKWLDILKMYLVHNAFTSPDRSIVDTTKLLATCRWELHQAEERTKEPDRDTLKQARSAMNLANALSRLSKSEYDEAATFFIESSAAYSTQMESVVSLQDLSFYAGLCALSAQNFSELGQQIRSSSFFLPHLAEPPGLLELLDLVCAGDVTGAATIITKLGDYLTVDPYLSKHTTFLATRIVDNTLLQFLRSRTEPLTLEDIVKLTGISHGRLARAVAGYIADEADMHHVPEYGADGELLRLNFSGGRDVKNE